MFISRLSKLDVFLCLQELEIMDLRMQIPLSLLPVHWMLGKSW